MCKFLKSTLLGKDFEKETVVSESDILVAESDLVVTKSDTVIELLHRASLQCITKACTTKYCKV